MKPTILYGAFWEDVAGNIEVVASNRPQQAYFDYELAKKNPRSNIVGKFEREITLCPSHYRAPDTGAWVSANSPVQFSPDPLTMLETPKLRKVPTSMKRIVAKFLSDHFAWDTEFKVRLVDPGQKCVELYWSNNKYEALVTIDSDSWSMHFLGYGMSFQLEYTLQFNYTSLKRSAQFAELLGVFK